MEHQGLGLLTADEEMFSRVWDRVTAARPAEEAPPQPPAEPAPSAALCTPAEAAPHFPVDPTCAALQRWVLCLLADGEMYRVMSRRVRRGGGELAALGREKHRQARSLGAEYFLRTGVRYWPQATAQPLGNMPSLPALRAIYLNERRREDALRAQAAQEEPELANRYLELAEAARAAARQVRTLLEAVW